MQESLNKSLSATNYETIICETFAGGTACRITINRPGALNALNTKVLAELECCLEGISCDLSVRVVTLEGAGEKAFVAGADIAQMREMDPLEAARFARLGQRVTLRIESMPQIVVGKVRGFALGGGCELAMACDIIVASSNAKFGQPEVNLGLIPGFGGTQRLVRRVGLPLALDMICSGRSRMLTANEALNAGLVSRVSDPEKLDAAVAAIVDGLLAAGPSAVCASKRLVRDAWRMDLSAGLSAEADAFAQCWSGNEAVEGMNAFLEKRAPQFK
jgi:enoyl-CoA hydratase